MLGLKAGDELGHHRTVASIEAHVALVRAIGIDSHAAFLARSMMERALWERMLAIAAVVAWKWRREHAAVALGAAALGHGVWFTGIVLNPLIEAQQARPWRDRGRAALGHTAPAARRHPLA